MFDFLRRSRKPSPVSRKANSFRPALEGLEGRLALSTAAAHFNVTSALDNGAVGTLRWAVGQANADTMSGVSATVSFASSLRGSTIKLTRGDIEFTPARGLCALTVDGGSAVTVSGNNGTQVFVVDSRANVQLSNLTITNGFAYKGGAAQNWGNLGLENCTLSNNGASYGGAIYNGAGGTLNLFDSTLSGNTASQEGGGIYNAGTVMANNDALMNNTANYGAGISSYGNLEMLTNCYFYHNTAVYGGGALYNGGQASIGRDQFLANSARYGGAIDDYGSLNISFSDFRNSYASIHGAAIFVGHGYLSTFHETSDSFSGNSSPDHYNEWYA
jgi:hypothetical protein